MKESVQPQPRYASHDRNVRHRRELAIKATNEHFEVLVGNADLEKYTSEQALYFARVLFNDESITKAVITPDRNVSTGFNEFYIEAWVS